MKKFAIMVIALMMLVIGFAMADSSYSMQMTGIWSGTAKISEDSVMKTSEGLFSSKVNTFDMNGINGATQYARIVEGKSSGYDNSIMSSTAVAYDNGGFGGRLIGGEGVYSMMSSQGDCGDAAPFSEQASSEFTVDLNRGMFASETSMSSAIQPNLTNGVSLTAMISDADGSMRARSSISSIEGYNKCSDNSTISIPTSESSYSSRISMNGQFSNSFSFNYASTHGNITSTFPSTRLAPCCG